MKLLENCTRNCFEVETRKMNLRLSCTASFKKWSCSVPQKFARAPNPVGTDSSTYATANATGAADSCKSPYAPASIDEYSMSIRTSPSDLQWQPPQKPPPPPPVPVSAAAVASSSRVEVVEIDEESSLVRRSSKLDSAASQSQTSMSKTSAIQHAPPAEPHSALASVAAARSTAASKTNPYTDVRVCCIATF